MSNETLLAYLAECYPTIFAESITDEAALLVWHAQAKKWSDAKTAKGFSLALVEFAKLQGHRHYSKQTTRRHAHAALKKAGLA